MPQSHVNSAMDSTQTGCYPHSMPMEALAQLHIHQAAASHVAVAHALPAIIRG